MATTGMVRIWRDEQGWEVVDSAATPGGCWTRVSRLAVSGYRSLDPGRLVELEWEPAQQDGYAYRALRVWSREQQPHEVPADDPSTEGPAYRSTLTITFDEPPTRDRCRERRIR